MAYHNKNIILWLILLVATTTILVFQFLKMEPISMNIIENAESLQMLRAEKYTGEYHPKESSYNRKMPLIFIGGVPRSGTTLMRSMLDAHPDVRCGQETHVIPPILGLRARWTQMDKQTRRLREAGITEEIMDNAVAKFILEIITKHGEPAPRLCNKDPLTFKRGSYLSQLFPNAKFLLMVRDGRATVHSMISRNVKVTKFDLTSYRESLKSWNEDISIMYNQCKNIRQDRCMMVYYEQLVLHPSELMEKILRFLDLPWNDAVLHHEQFINKPNGVKLSKVERSSDQVIRPVNLEALSKWVGQIPHNVVRDMERIAPMLSVLGYDPNANPPKYGKPDAWVLNNTLQVKAHRKQWENKAKNRFQFQFWRFQ